MAEIKRLQSQQVFNKPIGIVQPSTSAVEAGRNLERLGSQMMQRAFEAEVDVQKQKGIDAARGFAATNTDQEIVYRKLPQGLSKIAQREAQPIIDKKYSAALLSDMKAEAKKLRADFDKDPDGFDNAFSAYVKKTAELTDPRYKAIAIDVGAEIAGQNTADIYADKAEADDAQDYKNMFDAITSSGQDLEAFIGAGAPIHDGSVAHAKFMNTMREIDELVDLHGDRMSVTQERNMRTNLKRQYGGAMASSVVAKLQALPEFQDPAFGADMAANVINALEQVYRSGSIDAIEPAVMKHLTDAGFSERMISGDVFDSESRRVIAGDISVMENNFQERLTATKSANQAGVTMRTLSEGGVASQDHMNNLFDNLGYNSVESLMNDLPNILNPANKETQGIRNILLHNNSDLPDVVRNIFTTDNLQRLANNGQLPLAMDLFQQTTKRLNVDGSGVNTVQRGISNDVMAEMASLNAYRNGVKDASFVEYFQRKGELKRDPQRKEMLNSYLGSDGNNKQITIGKFVDSALPSDATPEEKGYYLKYAEDLVLMHGTEKATEILEQSANKVFVKSKFISNNVRSRFAPEKAFPLRTDMDVFQVHTQSILDTADGDYKLGDNAFLIPDPRHGSVNPVYMLVDENNMPIMSGSKPLLTSGQAVVEQRMKMNQKTSLEVREQMRVEYQRRLQFGKQIDDGDFGFYP